MKDMKKKGEFSFEQFGIWAMIIIAVFIIIVVIVKLRNPSVSLLDPLTNVLDQMLGGG